MGYVFPSTFTVRFSTLWLYSSSFLSIVIVVGVAFPNLLSTAGSRITKKIAFPVERSLPSDGLFTTSKPPSLLRTINVEEPPPSRLYASTQPASFIISAPSNKETP